MHHMSDQQVLEAIRRASDEYEQYVDTANIASDTRARLEDAWCTQLTIDTGRHPVGLVVDR